jgi:hypothetical protein
MKEIKICLLALVFTLALVSWAQAGEQTQSPSQTQGQDQNQGQGQGQEQGQYLSIGGSTSINRNYAIPYQLFPPALAPEFGNGNTFGNFVKVPAAFSIKKRFSRCELETMSRSTHTFLGDDYGIKVKFRSWGGQRVNPAKPTDYVDFVWELPRKQVFEPNGRPKLDDKGQPVFAGEPPATWCQLGIGTATVTNGEEDTFALISRYGLFCLNTGKCNTVFLVGEGVKTFIRSYGWNLSFGYTQAYVSSSGDHSGVGGVGIGYAYAKTGRHADPWLQGHFIYDTALDESEPAQ